MFTFRSAIPFLLLGGAFAASEVGSEPTKTDTGEKPPGSATGAAGPKAPAAEGKAPAAPVPIPEATFKKILELHERAQTLIKERRYAQAVEQINEALKLNPAEPVLWYSRGYVYYMLRDMEKSLADLNHTMELRPRYADALLNRAMVHFDMTQFELALKDLEEVLRIQPGNEMATQYVRVLKRVRDGPAWPKTYKAASAHYAVSTDVDQSAANLATLDLERIYAEYARQFQIKDTDQKRKLNVRIFSTQEGFLEYGHETFVQAHEGVVGYYSKIFKELVILNHSDRRQVTKTIYHEGFHQFMDYFISSAPPWFDEGLANYFELSQWTGRSFDLGAVSPAMLRTIQDGITYNLCVPLAKLLRLSRDEFADPQPTSRPNVPKYRVHYAEAWSFVHFLIHADKGKHKRVIRDFYLALKQGAQPEEAFEDVFGKANFSRVEKAWQAYVRTLAPKPEPPP